MNMILLGDPRTERTEYFLKAAQELRQPVNFIPLPSFTEKNAGAGFDFSLLRNSIVKADPPPPESYPIDELNTVMNRYHGFLRNVQDVPGIMLLNSADAIWDTLDKFTCKQRLQQRGLPVTPALAGSNGFPARFGSHDQLKKTMREKGIRQVFIKPRFGSGATGVAAYRYNLKTGAEMMESSAVLSDKRLYNTRKLRKTGDSEEIRETINHVLAQEAIVEEWIPKASLNGKTFDLRAVFQGGRLEFIVARQSNGAITNLHLNDMAAADFSLSPSLFSEIESLCRKAAAVFPGLNVAGLDILLQKHTMSIMIIEINGQGDLIYKDIFAENRIFKAQIKAMKSL